LLHAVGLGLGKGAQRRIGDLGLRAVGGLLWPAGLRPGSPTVLSPGGPERLARLSLSRLSGGGYSVENKESGMKLGTMLRTGLVAAGLVAGAATGASAQETIKVGILHSLSGTMAISETTLKDVMLMLIEEQNKKGGLLGKKLEAVVVDPASNWPLFAEKARELLQKDKVAVVFGCWTSVSRKSVLPVFEELNGLLFYPVQYEGQESQRNVFYTGAAPNQQAIPAVDYLMSKDGGEVKRWVLAGTDYVYPRTTNKILEGVPPAEGRQEGRHHDQLHAVRSFRLAVDRGGHQEVRLGRQEDRRRVDHQRRRQRSVLQGARQPGHQGQGHPGRGLLGR